MLFRFRSLGRVGCALLLLALPIMANARNLAAYETLGPLDSAPDPRPTIQQVNAFVLKHWQSKVPGHVTFTLHTKEGLPTTTEAFIEQDANKVWSIWVSMRGSHFDPEHRGVRTDEPVLYTAYQLSSTIGGDGNLVLFLKDQAGKRLDTWGW